MVVCDTFNDRMVKYSSDGSSVRIFNSSPPLHKPSAVVLLPVTDDDADGSAEESFFAVKDHTAIYIFNEDCQQQKVLAKKTLKRPYGETLTRVDVSISALRLCNTTIIAWYPNSIHQGTIFMRLRSL